MKRAFFALFLAVFIAIFFCSSCSSGPSGQATERDALDMAIYFCRQRLTKSGDPDRFRFPRERAVVERIGTDFFEVRGEYVTPLRTSVPYEVRLYRDGPMWRVQRLVMAGNVVIAR